VLLIAINVHWSPLENSYNVVHIGSRAVYRALVAEDTLQQLHRIDRSDVGWQILAIACELYPVSCPVGEQDRARSNSFRGLRRAGAYTRRARFTLTL